MPARRTLDPAPLLEQSSLLCDWLDQLEPGDLERPATLAGRTVAQLVAQLTLTHRSLVETLDRPTRLRALPLTELVRRSPAETDQIAVAGTDPRSALTAAAGVLAARLSQPLPERVAAARGPGATADVLALRLVDLVVHSDDLSRSLTDRGAVPLARRALGGAVRTLTTLLAERHPGRSVEVRVPPYAAVQCGVPGDPGPAHTRGTPPNVVECEPLTFLRLAAGRLSWAETRAAGAVRASGLRADLSDVMPLVR